jgi:hypothetical protein
MSDMRDRTDAELAQLDVAALLAAGLGEQAGGGELGERAARGELFGDGAVAAAIALDGVDVIPRSVTFLAEIVRSGGVRYAAELAEPLPRAAQAAVIRPWLSAASVPSADDEQVARWLEAVAAVLALRASTRQAR